MSELITIPAGDIHSISYSDDRNIPLLTVSLKIGANLQRFRERILKDLSHVTFFKWEIGDERVFSVPVIGDQKIQSVIRRMLRHFN